MTWHEYRDRVKESVIFLPVGSMEQHGPHLPLGTDTLLAGQMAELAAERVGGIVLPTIPFGYKSQPSSGGGQLFPGTTSMNADTLVHVVLDVLQETYRHGGRKFVLFNGHYENVMFLTEAADLFVNSVEGARVLMVDWTALLTEEMVQDLFEGTEFPGWDVEHAAVTETSLMKYFAPELVRENKIVDGGFARKPVYAVFPPDPSSIPSSGVLYKATFASREKGERLIKNVIPRVAEVVQEVFG
jgi:creatinine amidohydrolase